MAKDNGFLLGFIALFFAAFVYMLYRKNESSTIVDYIQGQVSEMSGITNDPATWPKGDKIWDICRAIAFAEGANIAGSVPDRLNNPGDISDGALTFATNIPEYHSGSVVTHFPDKLTGWTWLYNKIKNHVTGQSDVYPADLSVTAFAQKYAGNWQNWVTNVANYLKIQDPSSVTFSQYVNS